jgi:hypothetical protein
VALLAETPAAFAPPGVADAPGVAQKDPVLGETDPDEENRLHFRQVKAYIFGFTRL